MGCPTCESITYSSKGPKGDKGATGATGAAGTPGAQGPAGTTSVPVIDQVTATLPLTAGQTGSLILLDRPTGITVTLPSVPPNGTTFTFQQVQNAFGGTYVINVNGAGLDSINGFIYMNKAATAPALFVATTATTMVMNETTTGGLAGGNFTLVYYNNSWIINGQLFGSGAVATPFS